MDNKKVFAEAIKIAVLAHHGATTRDGMPYILHPLFVAKGFTDSLLASIAVLHDVVEDTDVSFEELESKGMPDRVISALRLLTKQKNELYHDYILRLQCGNNEDALRVKLADLDHNMDLRRLPSLTEKDFERNKKYLIAKDLITSSLNTLTYGLTPSS